MMHGPEESDSAMMLCATSRRLCCPGFYVRGGVADEES
jgi:hypothetical protein